jgi:hypothetical protein
MEEGGKEDCKRSKRAGKNLWTPLRALWASKDARTRTPSDLEDAFDVVALALEVEAALEGERGELSAGLGVARPKNELRVACLLISCNNSP